MRQKGGGYHCLHENKSRLKLSFQIHSSSRGMGIIFVSKLDSDFYFYVKIYLLPLSTVILFRLLIRQPLTKGRDTLVLQNGTHQSRKCRVDQYLAEIAFARVAPAAQSAYPTMTRCSCFIEIQCDFIMRYNL